MFKFLKDKLNATISKISEKIKAEGSEEVVEQTIEKPVVKEPEVKQSRAEAKAEPIEKKGLFERIKETFTGKSDEEIKEEAKAPKPIEAPREKVAEEFKAPSKEVKRVKESKKEEEPEVKAITRKAELPPEEVLVEREKLQPDVKEVEKVEVKETKKGFFQSITEKIVTKKISEKQFEDLFWELELALMENNVAVEVIEKIKEDLKAKLVDTPIRRNRVNETIVESLKASIRDLFLVSDINVERLAKIKKPFVICFVGINGSGKTTSIAKMAHMLKARGFSVVISASDTFRAASIDQLQKHADALGVKLIKHDYGADPAAVAFDAIRHAESKKVDVVLIDTAGRMQTNQNLIDEMKKIVRVAKPDLKIFVGEAITGNDCVEQAKTFNEAVGIDGIILAKADIDEKGGAAVSVSYVTKKPILYIGTGQKYEDLQKFEPDIVIKSLGLEA